MKTCTLSDILSEIFTRDGRSTFAAFCDDYLQRVSLVGCAWFGGTIRDAVSRLVFVYVAERRVEHSRGSVRLFNGSISSRDRAACDGLLRRCCGARDVLCSCASRKGAMSKVSI